MFASRLWRSYNSSTLSVINYTRFLPSFIDPGRSLSSLTSNFNPFLTSGYVLFSSTVKRNFAVSSSVQPGPPSPSPSGKPSNSRKKWVAGMLLSIVTLPFGKDKLNSFLELENEVEVILEGAELVADVVENVAEEVVKITDVLADQFPNSKDLKWVEKVGKEIVRDATRAEGLIHKVQEVEEEVESVIEAVMGQVNSNVTKEASTDDGSSIPIEKVPKSKL